MIAGIFESEAPQDQNVAYTHLEFVQRAAGNNDGIVTQFTVLVDEPGLLDEVARQIDSEFSVAQAPTRTWTEKEFVARAVTDILEIVSFASWLGWGALAAVFALVANTIILSVHDRVRDHAILQTLGYTEGLIARLIIAESVALSLIGGFVGVLAGYVVVLAGRFSFSVEGLSVNIQAGLSSVLVGLLVCEIGRASCRERV